MNLPQPGDFIDIHNHNGSPVAGRYSIENLMAHEPQVPDFKEGIVYTFGIHPWFLSEDNFSNQMEKVRMYVRHENVAATGEAGFDKLKGPSIELQTMAFDEQVKIAEEYSRPVYIHCVKAWGDLLAAHRRLKPSRPWLVHGFRGKKDLALQLLSRGMYISFWFEFVLRPESRELIRNLPSDRIFLETDGSGEDISEIYKKVAVDLGLEVDQLKKQINSNFNIYFGVKGSR
jgi:TatD DNase family protein